MRGEADDIYDEELWGWGKDETKPRFLHAMIRVTDFERSLKFYTELLGMAPMGKAFEIPERKVKAIFVGFEGYSGPGIEIVHKWDEQGPWVHSTGYTTHTSIGVPDLDAMERKVDAWNVEWVMRPTALIAGGPRNSFIRDPDGYLVEMTEINRNLKDKR